MLGCSESQGLQEPDSGLGSLHGRKSLSERRRHRVAPLGLQSLPPGTSMASPVRCGAADEIDSAGGRYRIRKGRGAFGMLREQACGVDEFHATYEFGEGSLGSGSTCVVKPAWHRKTGQALAVKCIACEDEEMKHFTFDEYELVRELIHPNILRVHALYQGQTQAWLCMDLCDHGSLEKYVEDNGRLQELQAKDLGLQLLQGVHFLHEKRVVHRDLKPANVLLASGIPRSRDAPDDRLRLKIADFNSAKLIGMRPGAGVMLTFRGTHLYSAPELRFGRLWNERIDIWASGFCLYFMVMADFPFNSENRSSARLLLSGRLPDVRWDGTSALMRHLVLSCLTVNMHDRPPAMELLVHPVFGDECALRADSEQARSWHDLSALRAGRATSKESDPAGDGRAAQSGLDAFTVLPAVGLLAWHPWPGRRSDRRTIAVGTNRMVRSPEESPLSQDSAWASSGMAHPPSRSEQILRQLARSKCERSMAEPQLDSGVSQQPAFDALSTADGDQSSKDQLFWTMPAI